jgi:hypothetical protein
VNGCGRLAQLSSKGRGFRFPALKEIDMTSYKHNLVFASVAIATVLALLLSSLPARARAETQTSINPPEIPAIRPAVDSTDASLLRLTRQLGLATDIAVAPGTSVQTGLNTANCGDRVILEAGVAYQANLTIGKQCAEPITIQSSRISELPEGQRVTPAQAPLLAKLQSTVNGEPVIKTTVGARGYRFIGVDVSTTNSSVVVYDLVRFGEGRQEQKTLESVPSGFTIDRSWIHGWSDQDVQRGVSVNSADTTISNSWISDIHGVGFDTQAIAGWNGTKNFKAINNYLEAAGENIMFGGADAVAEAFIPTGIEILGNAVVKPLSWKVGDPSYAGKHWTVKNLLELKSAKNVTIIGNVFENNWTDGQAGVPILFTVRNQECTNPFATIQNVTFNYNTIRNAEGVFNFLGKDNEAEPGYEDRPGHVKCSDPGESFGSVRGSGFSAAHNLTFNIRGSFLTLNGFDGVSFDRTTDTLRTWNFATIYGQPSQRFKYTNGVTIDHEYGIWTEDGKKVGDPGGLVPGGLIEGNVVVPYDKSSWPLNNQFLTSLVLPPDFRSPFVGKGADIDALLAAQGGTVVSVPSPSATPTVTVSPTPLPSPSPSPSVTPTPIPSPSPTPVTPAIGSLKTVVWETTETKQDLEAARQRVEGWYFYKHLSGKRATFVYTGAKLP